MGGGFRGWATEIPEGRLRLGRKSKGCRSKVDRFISHTPHVNLHIEGVWSRIEVLSDTMYLLISLRESTPPQNRQINILFSNSKQQDGTFVGELAF